jgi:nucleoside-diphosphate-sugar epimerase
MKVAVTGAGGLLGGAVCRKLLESTHDVIALSGSIYSIAGLRAVRWNASQDWKETAKSLHLVDAIVHTGAHIPTNHNDDEEAQICFEVNALGTLNLLRAAELAKVQRFIYVSGSNALYSRSDFVNEFDPVGCEHSPYYLGSKILGEIYVRARIARGLSGLIIRPSSIYGPGMKVGALWSFAEKIRMGLPIELSNDGRFRADFVWRDDVAKILCDAAVGHQVGEVNLGSGESVTMFDAAKLILEIFKADENLIHFVPSSGISGLGFPPVDISRARNWFNFNPTALRDGLINWFEGQAS